MRSMLAVIRIILDISENKIIFVLIMRWKAKILPSYQVGTIRSNIHYAILPKRVGDNMIWLQRYESVYVYSLSKIQAKIATAETREFDIYNWIKLFDREL